MRSLLLRGQQFIHGNIFFNPWTPAELGSSLALWLDANDASSLTLNLNAPFPSTFSAQFDGSGDYLSTPSNSAFQFGTGDFTMECWINMPAGTALTSYWRSFLSVASDSAGGNSGVTLYIGDGSSGSTVPGEVCAIVGANAIRIGSGQDIRGLGWVHVALTRSGTTLRLFVNGALTVTASNSSNINSNSYGAQIGLSLLSQNNFFIGAVSNVRVVKGTSVYTSAFQPPSAPLTAISGTSLLTLQSSTFIDNSPNNFTITKFGDTFIPSTTTVSQWRDKSGNALHVSQSTGSLQPTYTVNGLNGKPTLDWGAVANNRGSFRLGMTGYSPVRYFGVADYDGANPFPDFVGLVSHNFTAFNDLLVASQGSSDFFGTYFFNGSTTSSSVALPTMNSPFLFATDFAQNPNRTSLFIGNDRNVNRGWQGKISEIIALNTLPSTDDRQRLEGYLAHKWGTTADLPETHPYRFAAPTTIS